MDSSHAEREAVETITDASFFSFSIFHMSFMKEPSSPVHIKISFVQINDYSDYTKTKIVMYRLAATLACFFQPYNALAL
jgi:hypothetical protein